MINREQWLLNAVSVLRDGIFSPRGTTIPDLKLSVGLPHARNQRRVKIQFFPADMNADRVPCIFVSPLLDDGSLIIAQLYGMLREIYAPTNHTLPTFTPDLSRDFLSVLGDYPSSALKLPDVETQSTRMLKLQCSACGYTLRATNRWLSKGIPLCYCNQQPFRVFKPAASENTANEVA